MKLSTKLLFLLMPAFLLLTAAPSSAKADDATSTVGSATSTPVDVPSPVSINFDVEAPSSTIFSNNLSVPACATPNNATSTVNGFCAFAAANLPVDAKWSSFGALVNSINGVAGDSNNFWLWFLNGDIAPAGIDSYILKPNDNVLWTLGREPLKVSLSTTTPMVNATTTVTVLGFDPIKFDFEPLAGATIVGASKTTNANGTADIVATTTTPLEILVTAQGFIPSQQFIISPLPQYSHQIILSVNSVTVGQPFTATAEQFDLISRVYKPMTGVTLGVGTINSDSTSTIFNEVATSTVDSNGQAIFTLSATGTLAVGIKEDAYIPTFPIIITDATTTIPVTPQQGGGSGGISHPTFNLPNALAFISGQQSPDGSFGSAIPTDWTALAFAASSPGAAKTKLHDYLVSATPAMSSITDYERHAMALEALGINPYSDTAVNYISPIAASFDGTQIGDKNLVNDDIFSIFPLMNAGYGPTDPIIQKEITYIMSAQLLDGSWMESPDLTAAAILAVGPFFNFPNYPQVMGAAAGYLMSTQKADGGWGNVDSTSWAQTAINAIPADPNHPLSWTSKAGFLPKDELAAAQQSDGGVVSSTNRVWSTSYAVVAASGQSWLTILQSFPKPIVQGGGSASGGGMVLGVSTSTIPGLASTTPASTTTPELASSTSPTIAITLPPITVKVPAAPIITAPKPKIKLHKLPVKIVSAAETQNQGSQIQNSPTPSPTATPTPPSPKTGGFFTRLWQAISTFFGNLF